MTYLSSLRDAQDRRALDALVVNAIKIGRKKLVDIVSLVARAKRATPRVMERQVDRSLQRLRKRGIVTFDKKTGWGVVAP